MEINTGFPNSSTDVDIPDKKYLWVFGNAVQDITVEVDIERLSRELGGVEDLMIHMGDQGPEITAGLRLRTQAGSQEFAISMELETSESRMISGGLSERRYILQGGGKYTLAGDIEESPEGFPERSLFLPCENLSWGGGGVNVVTFLRALAPKPDVVPIKYTDIAMSHSLSELLHKLETLRREVIGALPNENSVTLNSLTQSLSDLYDSDSVRVEEITSTIAKMASNYAPDRSLDVYLASLPVDGVLYRPEKPRFRRNLVFSRFRSAYREIDNKIVLRGNPSEIPDEEEIHIAELLRAHRTNIGGMLLNSLKDGPLFRAAYSLYKEAYSRDENVVAILAMTDAMQRHTDWLLANPGPGGEFPPFILVLNEMEAYKFANMLGGNCKPFMQDGGFPDICEFGRIALTLLKHFDRGRAPRIYVTAGPRGSLGVDGYKNVVYVSSFAKRGATVYDTNACGDAYCAAITMLEWAKRHRYKNIAGVNFNNPHHSAEEMRYFMAVATAAAYCKATNRRGRVYAADVKDLLQHNHLASVILPSVTDLANLKPDTRPDYCIDENFRLREPAEARYIGVTKELSRLIS